jgi:glutamate 5-kinase
MKEVLLVREKYFHMEDRIKLRDKKKIVIKIGTSSLANSNGKINLQRIERLAMVVSDLRNNEKQVILVSSGAIAVGAGKLGLSQKPSKLSEKQALAAIGQAELIKIYEKFFTAYNQVVAQILLTKDGVMNPIRRYNAKNTLNTLLNMNIIPIINENDTVSTDEIEFGDNDTLSAHVAVLAESDLLIILSDIEGLYNNDPRKDETATIISKVKDIEKVEEFAGSTDSKFAKGGMVTKIAAANLCNKEGIDVVIASGENPSIIFDIFEGKEIGTLFIGKTEYEIEKKGTIPPHLFKEKLG